jgi:hypothetical protein
MIKTSGHKHQLSAELSNDLRLHADLHDGRIAANELTSSAVLEKPSTRGSEHSNRQRVKQVGANVPSKVLQQFRWRACWTADMKASLRDAEIVH